jgi:hypothetical protein
VTASWGNQSGTDKAVFIVVDGSGSSGVFALDVAIGDPPAGDTCGTATAVTPGTLSAQTTVGYSNDYHYDDAATSCTAYRTLGPDRVYSISVGAGQKLTVTVEPDSTYDPAVYLVAAPATNCTVAPTCLIGADAGFTGGQEQVEWTNSGGSPQVVFIIVDGYTASTAGGFALTTALQ